MCLLYETCPQKNKKQNFLQQKLYFNYVLYFKNELACKRLSKIDMTTQNWFRQIPSSLTPFIISASHHGTDGPLPVSELAYETPLAGAWLQAGIEHGYPNVDYNGYQQKGKEKHKEIRVSIMI